MSGYVGDLSEHQERCLVDIKDRIAVWLDNNQDLNEVLTKSKYSIVGSDPDMLRFLRARKFDVIKSFEMCTNFLRWSCTFQGTGIDALTLSSVHHPLHSRLVCFVGYDKQKRPVSMASVKHHDQHTRNLEEWQRFVVLMMECCRTILQPPNYTYTLIFNMEGFSMKNMDYALVKFLISMLQDCYPEFLGQCFVVNSPWIFHACWKLIKAWLDPETAKKIVFVKETHLLEHFPEDVAATVAKIMTTHDNEAEYQNYLEIITKAVEGSDVK